MADVKAKTATTNKDVAKEATKAVEEKKTVTPAAAEAKTEKKESAKKVAVEEKKTAKKPGRKPGRKPGSKSTTKADKKKEREQEIYIEYAGNTIVNSEIINKIEEAFKAEGHRISTIKDLRVYVNVEEKKAYYVINGKPEDKFVEL